MQNERIVLRVVRLAYLALSLKQERGIDLTNTPPLHRFPVVLSVSVHARVPVQDKVFLVPSLVARGRVAFVRVG